MLVGGNDEPYLIDLGSVRPAHVVIETRKDVRLVMQWLCTREEGCNMIPVVLSPCTAGVARGGGSSSAEHCLLQGARIVRSTSGDEAGC